MTPLVFTLLVALGSIFAGLLGSLVGVGGGVIVVPMLSLFLGVDIRAAIAASIIAIVATSNGAASGYVRQRLTNLRLAMLLETATAAGALCGAFAAVYVPGRGLHLLFSLVLLWTAWNMSRPKPQDSAVPAANLPDDPWARKLRLDGAYYDKALQSEVAYRVGRTKLGLAVSYAAGILSGLLGIGGGVLKVPVMHLAMGIPIKACTATSNFMIGVTAAAGAAVYFARGDVLPFVAAPVAVGIILGAKIGSRLLGRLKSDWVRIAFVAVMVLSAAQMAWKGVR